MFVPGHRQRMIQKALGVAVDAIMLDIEDGVAPAEKDAARREIAEALDQVQQRLARSPSDSTPVRFVRLNAVGHERMRLDLSDVLRPGLEGFVVPKVESPEQVRVIDVLLQEREEKAGIIRGTIRLLIAIESPMGLLKAYDIASCSPRVIGLMFGAEDYSKEVGLPLQREKEAQDLLYARSALVTAASAAHVQAVDGVWPNLQDQEGLKAFALQSRRLGFSGMSLIHPSQIDPINVVFTPTPQEIEFCRRVVAAFQEARARGEGSIAFGGQLIDLPIVERANRTLELAESLNP
jgi:citrate lyase subunit beta/citryl-CoA lyase